MQVQKWIPQDVIDPRSRISFITGDGPGTEYATVRGFAKKYDGQSSVLITSRKPPIRIGPAVHRGLPSLELVRIYLERFGISKFVWSCDKEYLTFGANPSSVLQRTMQTFGLTPQIESDWGDSCRISATLGNRIATIWCAFTGRTRNIEENIAELIRLQHGVEVSADKDAIRSHLGSRNLSIEELIVQSSDENLHRSFTCYHTIFANLHEQII